MKAQIYLALAAVFAVATFAAQTVFPQLTILVLWTGILAITFRFLALRAWWTWQGERTTAGQ